MKSLPSVAIMRLQDAAMAFFYADCAIPERPIGATDQRNLLQFVTQARLALRLCS